MIAAAVDVNVAMSPARRRQAWRGDGALVGSGDLRAAHPGRP